MFPTRLFCVIVIFLNIWVTTLSDNNGVSTFAETDWLKEVLRKFKEKKAYFMLKTGMQYTDTTDCSLCRLLMSAILQEIAFEMTDIQVTAEAEYFCEILNIKSDDVCEGIIEPNVDVIGFIARNSNQTANEICSYLLNCDGSGDTFEWTIEIPSGTTVEKKKASEKTFKIGHITDIHYDPKYTEGKVLNCGEPLCCQIDQEDATENQTACGYWGSEYDADCPLRLVEEALDQLVQQKPDFVYFTGDLVSHRVWGTSHDFNSKIISDIMNLFTEKFGNIPVYPTLGNHEAHPVNVYAPIEITNDDISAQWLYNLLIDNWAQFKWFDNKTMKKTILAGGYYTVSPKKGLRVVVLNNNVCSRQNWWNLYSSYDPYGQLEWLADTLLSAEKNKEVVHILYHIPTSSCLKSWGQAYNKLLNRFSNTVAAQFNGHTHRDQFYIHYNDAKNPISVTFNGGSLMPDEAAPNYKIYTVDENSFDVVDSETYTFDLAEANNNITNPIEWYRLYSFKDSFEVSMTLTQLNTLVKEKMYNNDTLVQMYNNYYYRNSAKGQEKCEESCKIELLCKILTTVQGDISECSFGNL